MGKSKFATFCLPFIGKTSRQIKKEIEHFLENKIKAKFSFPMNHTILTIGNLLRNKDKGALLHLTGTVYKLLCICGKTYIGQIKQNIKTRLEEMTRLRLEKSNVTDHLRKNADHKIDFYYALMLTLENQGIENKFLDFCIFFTKLGHFFLVLLTDTFNSSQVCT